MIDLEITKLCAEAIGLDVEPHPKGPKDKLCYIESSPGYLRFECYDPLHDDEQAMALVKKFHLHIGHQNVAIPYGLSLIHISEPTRPY